MGLTNYLFADVLIVDTDHDFISSARLVLQSAGYTVRQAETGQAALDTIPTRPPDLILLSSDLPDISGHDVVRRIKGNKDLPLIPTIMLASTPDQADSAAALNAGADEFLRKPVTHAELLLRVRAMLRLKAAHEALEELNATLEQKVAARTRELEEAHTALRHSEKLSALGRLAASVAHDINNPLSSILAYLYLLKQDIEADQQMTEDLSLIERQVNVIANLVKQLRDFSRPTQQQRRAVALQEVIDDVILLTSKDLEKRGIEVAGHYSPTLPKIYAAPDQMSEILLNLAVNARDAMPDGGKLTFEAHAEGDDVVVNVTDTGCGMSPETQDRIFEPFFTTKGEEGTGLGLSICYRILQEHEGQIAVESEVGNGTTFTITLPQAKEKLTA